MGKTVCPKCKKKIDDLYEVCPKCGEIIFAEVIEVKELSEELLEETIDDVIQEENIIIRSIIKACTYISEQVLKLGGKLKCSIKQFLGKVLLERVRKLRNKLINKVKLIAKKIFKHVTYERFLGVSIVVSTLFLVGLCIRNVIYLDNKSEVSKVDTKTTSGNIQKLYNNKGSVSIDVSDGTVVYTYENQEVGKVKNCTVYYKINPSTNKVVDIYIVYDKNLFNTRKMRNYLIVNYGEPKIKKVTTIWSYENEELEYSFTNGVFDYKREEVHIRYKKNAPTNEELKSYGVISSEKGTSEKEKD